MGKWVKGQSGNPSGRPAIAAEVRDAIRTNGELAVRRMNELLADEDAWGQSGWLGTKEQIKLAEVAMLRAYGSAAQAPIGAGAAENTPEEIQNMGAVLKQVYHAMVEDGTVPEFIKARPADGVTEDAGAASQVDDAVEVGEGTRDDTKAASGSSAPVEEMNGRSVDRAQTQQPHAPARDDAPEPRARRPKRRVGKH